MTIFLLRSIFCSIFNPGSHIAFSCLASLVSFSLWQTLGLPLFFMTLTLWKSVLVDLFCHRSLNLGLSAFSCLDQGFCIFGRNSPEMALCPSQWVSGDMVMSAKFLYVIILFPLSLILGEIIWGHANLLFL